MLSFERWQLPGSVNYGEDIDLVGIDFVDNAIRVLEHFANGRVAILGNLTSRQRKRADLFGTPRNSIDHLLRITGRVFGNVIVNPCQLPKRLLGPSDSHGTSPNCFLTSATGTVRPALLSARPASIASRT